MSFSGCGHQRQLLEALKDILLTTPDYSAKRLAIDAIAKAEGREP
jgi:hypothetical protein